MTDNPRADVAQDLRTIVALHDDLLTQAVHSANDPLMPGGQAMVELAYVALPSQYARQIDYLEEVLETYPDLNHEDDSWEPPLQTLLFWSERWRIDRGFPLEDRRPTIGSEAHFLRTSVDWAWENELHFEDFVKDVADAKRRIENTLSAGNRVAFRGVPCMYESCRGTQLVRKTVPTRGKNGKKTWRLSDWHCPKCKRSWTPEEYTRNIYAAIQRSKIEQIDDELWCTVDHAATRTGRPEGTVRSWVSRGDVSAVCWIDGRRTLVRYADVEARDRLAKARHLQRLAVTAAKRAPAV